MKSHSFKALLCYVFVCATSFAQSTAVTNTSTSTLEYQWARLKESMQIDFKNLSGFSVQQEEEGEFEGKIDYDEPPTGRMLNELAVGYKVSNDVVSSLVGVWSVRPGASEGEGGTFEVLDPYVKLAFDGVIEKGNFEMSSDLRLGAPVSRESKEGNKIVTIGSEQELEYQFGNSRWSTEVELYFQYNAHKGSTEYSDFEFRYEPALLYELSSKTYARMAYESMMRHERHDKLTLIDNRDPAVQAGIGWHITKMLEVYPFIDVSVKEPGTKNALYGALVSWSVL